MNPLTQSLQHLWGFRISGVLERQKRVKIEKLMRKVQLMEGFEFNQDEVDLINTALEHEKSNG